MNNLPDGWTPSTLGDIAEKEYGLVDGPFGSNLRKSEYVETGVPVIRGSNLTLGTSYFEDSEFVYITDEKANELERSNCFGEDIIFTKKGTLGQTGFIPKNHHYERFVLSSNQMKLTVDRTKANPYFVYYYVSSRRSIEKILRDAEATGVPKTNLAYLRTFPIHLPSPDEQDRIVEILKAVDDKIEANRRENETLEAIARAIFKSWFVDFDPVYAKANGEQPVGMDADTAALFPDSLEDSELGVIPRGWCVGELKDLCSKIENGGTPRRNETSYWESGTIKWLTSGEVRQKFIIDTETYITEEGLSNSSAKLWGKDTIVVALYGATAGQVTLLAVPSTANQACCGLTPLPHTRNFLHIHASNSTEALAMQARGSAQQNLSKGLVSSFPTVIPPDEILKKFEGVVSTLFDKMILNEFESRTLAETRDALLPRLISGELRVGEV